MPNAKEIEALKKQSLANLGDILDTAIRALSIGNPSTDEWKLIVHMVTWESEVHDYQDIHYAK